MNSSSAVFTRQNPFPPESHVARVHYNPSRAKISKPQKKLALSPVRFSSLTSPSDAPPQNTSLSPEDQNFLEGSHRVVFTPPSLKEGKTCSEYWPSVDLGPSVPVGSSPESQASRSQLPINMPINGIQEPSVLSKYIERFRYGRPQSREERQRSTADGVDGQTFWWMSSSPPSSSTPTQPSVECLRGTLDRIDDTGSIHSPVGLPRSCTLLSPTRGLFDLSALSESSHCEPGESEALQLQERARRLLQKSEQSISCGSSAVPISSVGLGCSDFSSPVTVDEPIRRPITPGFMDSANLLTVLKPSEGSPLSAQPALGTEEQCYRPEGDILFQWRLRRKMEQAREWSQTPSYSSLLHKPLLSRLPEQKTQLSPVFADLTQRASLSFTASPKEASCPLSTPVTQEPALHVSNAAVPKQSPESCKQTYHDSVTYSHSVPQTTKERVTWHPQAHCTVPRPHTRGQNNSLESSAEPRSKHQSPCSPLLQHSQSTEGKEYGLQHTGGVESTGVAQVKRGRRKTAPSIQKKKIHVGVQGGIQSSCHNAKAGHKCEGVSRKTKEPNRKNERHSRCQRSTEDVCSRDLALPPSPISNTLGQVVSEVLFPGPDSPAQARTSCPSYTPRYSSPTSPQSPTLPPQSIPQPCDVIDSDGLEFEDDPLLLVLRQQRKWVKEQICEVDEMLDELHED
ncbi:proline and serine-rich protein 3 isoform X2 [Electrophorus electricus]|uniref:proline and serine-rich protein 3 isoform X2 n=1 Tax=Electrophorus electricus TaxID=8005 RepID=UPI0015D06D5D|nr:proline and serine-rich protein 3 isoform X2 [Electrophorus electricus]